jgi:hypothetical protein
VSETDAERTQREAREAREKAEALRQALEDVRDADRYLGSKNDLPKKD